MIYARLAQKRGMKRDTHVKQRYCMEGWNVAAVFIKNHTHAPMDQ